MRSLSCKDLGSATCDFTANGETDESVIGQMKEHAKAHHPDDMKKMEEMGEEGMGKMMHSKMKTT